MLTLQAALLSAPLLIFCEHTVCSPTGNIGFSLWIMYKLKNPHFLIQNNCEKDTGVELELPTNNPHQKEAPVIQASERSNDRIACRYVAKSDLSLSEQGSYRHMSTHVKLEIHRVVLRKKIEYYVHLF